MLPRRTADQLTHMVGADAAAEGVARPSTASAPPVDDRNILTVWAGDGAPMRGPVLENVVHRIRERCHITSYYVAGIDWLWCKVA